MRITLLAGSLFIATPALAAEVPEQKYTPIGAPGSIALGVQIGASRTSVQIPDSDKSWRETGAQIAPSFDVFVVRGLSLGVSLPTTLTRREFVDRNGVSAWTLPTLEAFARVGYAIPIGERAAFWPMLRVGGGYTWDEEKTRYSKVVAAIDPRLVVNLTRSVFVTASFGSLQVASTSDERGMAHGPRLSAEMSAGIGGWI